MLFNISGEKYLLIYHNVHVRIIALEVHTTITGFHKNNSITFVFIATIAIMNEIGRLQINPCINPQIDANNDLLVAWKIICPPSW